MNSPRWKKLWRDLQSAQGRMLMMVIAIAVSIFGVGTILSSYTILMREISRNYLGTNPASAFLELDRVDDAVLKFARTQPNITDAQAGSWVLSRVEVKPNEWSPLLLFVVPDFNDMRLATFAREQGAWPPPPQTILLERDALDFAKVKIGDTLTMQTPNGPKQKVLISGSVHDPGLAPAWQEQMLYGYATPETLVWLGEGNTLHILKVAVKDSSNLAAIDSTIGNLAIALRAQGRTVGEIRIPPPAMHPHQSQMNSILVLLLVFSVMALLLSAILTATMIGGLLAQQIRQIGIMKAIGARSRQITGMYLALVVFLGIVAVIIGTPPGIIVGRGFASVVGELLNFTIYSDEVPFWVYAVLLLMGIVVPFIATLNPILQATRRTVREILSDYGTSREKFDSRGLNGLLSKIRGVDNTLLLAIRNTFRRRGRLALTLGLLASAGAMFITGINVKTGWETYLENAADDRHYDLEIRLNAPRSQEQAFALVSSVPGVQQIEAWNMQPAALYRADGLDIVRTYPDGGHGSFSLRSAPLASKLIATPMLSGRWLAPSDTNAVVLNQTASAFFPDAQVGDDIKLMMAGKSVTLKLVGIVRQLLTPATAYVAPSMFAEATSQSLQSTNAVRVVMNQHDADAVRAITGKIETSFATQNIGMKMVISESALESATSGHVYIFIFALILISAVMAVVGTLGLMSSIGTSVIERTREFGIMRAIGARSRTVLRNVISEGLFIGLLSYIIAIPLSLPILWGVDYLVGMMSFRSPLPLILSPVGLIIWLVVIVLGSIAASAYPARQASQLTVRETLSYI